VILYLPSTPGKAVSASPFATTCATLPLTPDYGQGISTPFVNTHGPQVRFGYRYQDTLRSGFTATHDLDGRAGEYGIVEPHMRLGNPHLYGVDLGMFVERPCGYPLCQGLGKLHGRSLDDVARHAVYFAVVHGLRQIIGGPRRSQVEAQLDANDERLTKLVLGLQGSVAAMEDHLRKEYAVLAHRFFLLPSIRISMPERKDWYARD
jgi:hypothetical protein